MDEAMRATRVVLVDDEETSRETLSRIFEQAEMEVDVAGTIEGALSVLRATPGRPLVVLNAHADAEAGMRFVQALGTDPALRARCVVVDIARATGNAGTQPARDADRTIERPLNQRELLALVREYVEGAGA
jgi:DNA-binding response OmpR family regulator